MDDELLDASVPVPEPEPEAPPVPDPSVPGHHDFVITPATGTLGAEGS